MSSYLGQLKRRLIELKLQTEEAELFEYLTDAHEVVEYLRAYLHDRNLKDSHGGWNLYFDKMSRPEKKLRRLK